MIQTRLAAATPVLWSDKREPILSWGESGAYM